MGRRGPHAIDKERLNFRAVQFANCFFTLRDGQPARIRTQGPGGWIEAGTIIPQDQNEARKFVEGLNRLSGTPWQIIPEICPNQTAWELLKRARTEVEIRRAAKSIADWAPMGRSDWRTEIPRAIRKHAKDLVRAKNNWAYPRDLSRPTSDDKRVVFFAKILASLASGLSPTYSIKVLAYWPWTKEWIQGEFVATENSFGGRIVDSV
jgi:hypothetical protein